MPTLSDRSYKVPHIKPDKCLTDIRLVFLVFKSRVFHGKWTGTVFRSQALTIFNGRSILAIIT